MILEASVLTAADLENDAGEQRLELLCFFLQGFTSPAHSCQKVLFLHWPFPCRDRGPVYLLCTVGIRLAFSTIARNSLHLKHTGRTPCLCLRALKDIWGGEGGKLLRHFLSSPCQERGRCVRKSSEESRASFLATHVHHEDKFLFTDTWRQDNRSSDRPTFRRR
ncbi:ATP-dependent DNA helicase pif1 [Fusarium oxysporum f. sp. albedinis]|nr:ATP-dependent DNA helicase pif1 [Fusarium oxysporum f. sp. albedinis]